MRYSLLGAACGLILGPGASAADCAPEAPCEVAGGSYVAVGPDGPPGGAMLFLHGYGGSGEAELRNAALWREVTDRGYVVIAPTAEPMRPGTPTKWNSDLDPARRDDIAYIAAVMADAGARFGFEPAGALAAGFSEGGMMIWRLACDAPERFAAFAPVSGVMWRPMPTSCAAPVRLLHSHGWSDTVVPLEGRMILSDLIQGDVFESLGLLRAASACPDAAPNVYEMCGEFQIRRWTDCVPAADIVFALHPGGHGIPQGWAGMVLDWLEHPEAKLATEAVAIEDGEG